MKSIILILFTSTFACNAIASDNPLKKAILSGYNKRCVEVLTGKGVHPTTVKDRCGCETAVINKNYNVFQLITLAQKNKNKLTSSDKEQIENIRTLLANCR